MKRTDFVKSILSLTGTAFVYGCKDVDEEILPLLDDVSMSLSLEDSKQ
ncbi:hypothetical protein [Runella slithyformis]|uniref:Uncharacterized protein n=1 Tax=Runella slithyformis (strain ATCC 29530 / DSM 19594 / LMG 11500 / NCIMB 11436 / LSU 4) TaxID=761193 RepID=A0A7U3ZHM2_RUNSL|nr:hypothetical protein [Runella slithyformis]AEI47389.1 hypothetical protein Runsl_0955 [Runella slithyformis DSM 19594]